MKKKISLFILCGIVLLGLCGCGNNEITNDKEINKNEEVKEDIDIKENETDTIDNDTNEDVNLNNKEETKPTISNNTSTTNDKKQETATKHENTTNNEDTKKENIDYNIINNSFKREYKATESEVYGYIHLKIIHDYCIPLVPEGSLTYDYCDVLSTDTKYSEVESFSHNDFSFLNLTTEEILSIEAKYYNEAINDGKDVFTDIYAFKDDGTLTKKFISKMEYWVLSKEINGTYSKIDSNTYYYNINYDDNGIIYISQNHFCKNNNNCNESDKYKKQ